MRNNRKINIINSIFNIFLFCVISSSIFLGNVKNVQAKSFSKMIFTKECIVEHLKLSVPKKYKSAWLKAEEGSWEPWLVKQDGFIGRQLFWDPKVEEATLLIGWQSKAVWKNISQSEINVVQQDFEKLAREQTGEASGNPFPLIYEGELNPQ